MPGPGAAEARDGRVDCGRDCGGAGIAGKLVGSFEEVADVASECKNSSVACFLDKTGFGVVSSCRHITSRCTVDLF